MKSPPCRFSPERAEWISALSMRGVRILCANELNRDACDTYAANHPEVRLIRGDLAEHMDELKQYRGVDLVFGGPPCQGFSVAGKWSRMTPAVN